jgi:mono/diheme cytochrome c family protein
MLLAATVVLGGCDAQLRKTDAELGLNPQQAAGRRVFDRHCGMCHEPYSPKSLRGPSLQAMFKKPYMVSGTPANDERVSEVVMLGRSKMPAFNRVLTQPQMEDLLAYLHTL